MGVALFCDVPVRWLQSLPHATLHHPARRISPQPPSLLRQIQSLSALPTGLGSLGTRVLMGAVSHQLILPSFDTDPCASCLLCAGTQSHSGRRDSDHSSGYHYANRTSPAAGLLARHASVQADNILHKEIFRVRLFTLRPGTGPNPWGAKREMGGSQCCRVLPDVAVGIQT